MYACPPFDPYPTRSFLRLARPRIDRYVMKSDNFNSRYDVTHPLETSEAVGEWAKVKGIPSVEALDKEGFKAHRPVGRIW